MSRKIYRNLKYSWKGENAFLIIVAAISFLLILIISYCYNISFRDHLMNLSGLILSFIIYALVINMFNSYKKNEKLKQKYLDNIEDYKDWQSKEGALKHVGNIKRLLNLGENQLDLSRCSLKDIYIEKMSFRKTNFDHADFTKSKIINCYFENCSFIGTRFSSSTVIKCTFKDCKMNKANFWGVILYKVDLDGSDIINFDSTNNLDKAKIICCSNLDEKLYNDIKKKNPNLLKERDLIDIRHS